jgi:deoxyadenosine/deoxycytidine kinase
MNFDQYHYIVVEGPIGVGKTTLSRRLAGAFEAQLLLEQPQENPFLDKFYRDSARYALPAQISFLLQRMNHLRELAQINLQQTCVVSDFLIDKDPIFAKLTLADEELHLYQTLYHQLHPQPPTPDLVIYLQAHPDTLIDRVHKRGLAMEEGISGLYLSHLCESYSRFFYDYQAAPLLIVNADHLNPIDRDDDFELLLNHIRNMRGKREFFNRGEF